MAGRMIAAFLVFSFSAAQIPDETPPIPRHDPCEGPPSEECEKSLVEAAEIWELRATVERIEHRKSLERCLDMQNVVPAPQTTGMTFAAVWAPWLTIGVMSAVLIGFAFIR